jgi:hypothetical protein
VRATEGSAPLMASKNWSRSKSSRVSLLNGRCATASPSSWPSAPGLWRPSSMPRSALQLCRARMEFLSSAHLRSMRAAACWCLALALVVGVGVFADSVLAVENEALKRELRLLLGEHSRLLHWARSRPDFSPLPIDLGGSLDALVERGVALSLPRKIPLVAGTDHIGGPRRAFYLPGLFSEDECDELVRISNEEDLLRPSKTLVNPLGDDRSLEHHGASASIRTSETGYIEERATEPVVRKAMNMLHAVSMSPMCRGEDLQVTRYNSSRLYGWHHDSGTDVGRPMTALAYLSNVRRGGQTCFPNGRLTEVGWLKMRLVELGRVRELQETSSRLTAEELWRLVDEEEGAWSDPLPRGARARELIWGDLAGASKLKRIKYGQLNSNKLPSMNEYCGNGGVLCFQARKGDAIVFFNHDMEMGLDKGAIHGGCPPLDGPAGEPADVKYIVQQWSRWFAARDGNVFARLLHDCGIA